MIFISGSWWGRASSFGFFALALFRKNQMCLTVWWLFTACVQHVIYAINQQLSYIPDYNISISLRNRGCLRKLFEYVLLYLYLVNKSNYVKKPKLTKIINRMK